MEAQIVARNGLPSIHDLIPFDLALQLIFQRIYAEKMNTAVAGQAHLDGLAHVVCAMVPLYIYTAEKGSVRQASAGELSGGLFAAGGKNVYFLDGRSEIRNLAVTGEAVNTVIAALAMALPD